MYRLAKGVLSPVVRFWVNLDAQGMEHVPPDGPVIIAANHISYFDPLCLGIAVATNTPRTVRFLAKSELFRTPLVGQVLKGAGQIPVHRDTRDARLALDGARRALEHGAAVIFYPEGTTTPNPDFSPGKPRHGVARLATMSGAPVVPVAIWGAHLLFAQGRIGPFRRGIRVVVRAGPPLKFAKDPDADRATIRDATDQIMGAITGMLAEVQADWSPPRWHRPRAVAG
jgi:1-acyl-sn-glycerol-3-phosphate acyltransferase